MSAEGYPIYWTDERPLNVLIADAQSQQLDYLLVQAIQSPAIDVGSLALNSLTDLVVFRDSSEPDRWSRIRKCLPPKFYFLAARPTDHLAIAISVRAALENPGLIAESQSWCELVLRLSASATTTFIDHVTDTSSLRFRFPSLTLADGRNQCSWLRNIIEQVPSSMNRASAIDLAAFQAGLFLMNDFYEESHSSSQSIEGLGAYHTGDYWHAILHRREPDYGNAKYWFRHVGQHPIFAELVSAVDRHFDEAQGGTASALQQWKTRLIKNGNWDAFAFVDLCSAAQNNPALRAWCEQVQYVEMLLLLEYSGRDVIRASSR